MRRLAKIVLACAVLSAAAIVVAACGTEKISTPNQAASSSIHRGAVIFQQRCAGCHTLSNAGTHGSAANVRTAQYNNGPNFDVRCERPATRVLYAIENGGFSGAVMPQNIVVGQDARDVAAFVSQYAGHSAPKLVGQTACNQQAIGALPQPGQTINTQSVSSSSTSAQVAVPGTNSKAGPHSATASGTHQQHKK
jgi:mono/diheme cytochrome c family protein